jgi:arginyl-tRNA synthetase
VDEVGPDAVRFFFVSRAANSHMDFDIELAKRQSSENPVYYVQYAHARIRSILRQPEAKEVREKVEEPPLTRLREPEERRLVRHLCLFEEEVASAARKRAPHLLTQYLLDTARAFHVFYTQHRVLGVEPALSRARLALVEATGIVLRNGLHLLGVEAPERM